MSCIYLGKKEYWDHIDNAARDVAAPVKRAREVGDGRLKALYAVQAGMNARDIQKNQKTDKAINKNNAVGINISLGSTGWKDQAETITEETRGSRITAGRTAAVIAKGDMTVKGSTVNAKDILLKVKWTFLFISNGKLCFYIYHFIPLTVWMIFVAISPFISPVTVPDRKRTGLYHRNAGVFNRRAEIRSCARLCVTPPMMLIPTGEKEFLR